MGPATAEERAVEEAIRLSVLQTSRGDPEEDARVEQSIRANVAQIERTRPTLADRHEDQMQQAMEASAAEHERRQSEQQTFENELQRVLTESLREQRGMAADEQVEIDSPAPNSPTFSDATLSEHPPAYDLGHVAGTTQEEFERMRKERPGEKSQQERSEEEIVLEYVKKQSLLEEEHRRKMAAAGAGPSSAAADENDEELQRALKLSLQGHHGEASGPS